jgi:hypothetical protein
VHVLSAARYGVSLLADGDNPHSLKTSIPFKQPTSIYLISLKADVNHGISAKLQCARVRTQFSEFA